MSVDLPTIAGLTIVSILQAGAAKWGAKMVAKTVLPYMKALGLILLASIIASIINVLFGGTVGGTLFTLCIGVVAPLALYAFFVLGADGDPVGLGRAQ